ncbi:dienelactone hydrolase family protein [Candidatus Nitrospira salsa]
MSEHTAPFTPDQIGFSPVRFSSSGTFITHKDNMVDPYAETRIAKEVQIEGTQFTPQVKELFPCLILLHDRWGLTSHVQAFAKQLACEGYVVLVPNLYGRLGGMITANDEVAESLMSRLDEQLALKDINACCEFLNTNIPEDTNLDVTKRNLHGVIGLGMGGGLAIQFAARRRRLRAVVSFSGSIPQNTSELAKEMYCPILYHAVHHNGFSDLESVNQLQQQAKEEGKTVEVQSYPDTPAGFWNQSNPDTYRPEASQQAWGTTVKFLNDILRSS